MFDMKNLRRQLFDKEQKCFVKKKFNVVAGTGKPLKMIFKCFPKWFNI